MRIKLLKEFESLKLCNPNWVMASSSNFFKKKSNNDVKKCCSSI